MSLDDKGPIMIKKMLEFLYTGNYTTSCCRPNSQTQEPDEAPTALSDPAHEPVERSVSGPETDETPTLNKRNNLGRTSVYRRVNSSLDRIPSVVRPCANVR